MTIYELSKELILGTRLKRLSDRFLLDVSNIYKTMNIAFEPSWFPIFFLLDRYTEMNVSDISNELDITKSGASQMISLLEKKDIVKITCGKDDKRTRFVSFDNNGFNLLKQIKPIWKLIQDEMTKMLDEGEDSPHFLKAISEIERSFKKEDLNTRVLRSLKNDTYSVSGYYKKYYNTVKELFFLWVFNHGIDDIGLLDDFNSKIKKNADYVFIALRNKDVAGTIITVLNGGKGDAFLCCREDTNGKANTKLVKHFIDKIGRLKLNCMNIRFDKDKADAADILHKNGFKKCSEHKSCDSERSVVIYRKIQN